MHLPECCELRVNRKRLVTTMILSYGTINIIWYYDCVVCGCSIDKTCHDYLGAAREGGGVARLCVVVARGFVFAPVNQDGGLQHYY